MDDRRRGRPGPSSSWKTRRRQQGATPSRHLSQCQCQSSRSRLLRHHLRWWWRLSALLATVLLAGEGLLVADAFAVSSASVLVAGWCAKPTGTGSRRHWSSSSSSTTALAVKRPPPGGRSPNTPPWHSSSRGGRGFAGGSNNNGNNKNSTFYDGSSSTSRTSSGQQQHPKPPTALEAELLKRVEQLEQLAGSQAVELRRLRDEVRDLTATAEAFAKVVELLRRSGKDFGDGDAGDRDTGNKADVSPPADGRAVVTAIEPLEDAGIFGQPPASVTEAADAAGAAILAALLGGQKRLLVDVRDAELSSPDPEALVQFVELALLPVAAGLEGLRSTRNRLKIVFPTVSQLLEYRRTMALSAPEVVALSTLGFDPVEPQDNLVVFLAPPPDDDEGWDALNALLLRDNRPEDEDIVNNDGRDNSSTADRVRRPRPIDQPVVVLNHHMIPVSGPAAHFEVAYHLRLLSVHYASGDAEPDDVDGAPLTESTNSSSIGEATPFLTPPHNDLDDEDEADAAFDAAVRHAHSGGAGSPGSNVAGSATTPFRGGDTRAMVVRSYPRPWHVFVDVSPAEDDADFQVAGTFDDEPAADDVNRAIVECLEGSEEEDEIVARQMQHALENGQLDRVTEMLGSMGMDVFDDDGNEDEGEDDDEDYDDDVWNIFNEDSV